MKYAAVLLPVLLASSVLAETAKTPTGDPQASTNEWIEKLLAAVPKELEVQKTDTRFVRDAKLAKLKQLLEKQLDGKNVSCRVKVESLDVNGTKSTTLRFEYLPAFKSPVQQKIIVIVFLPVPPSEAVQKEFPIGSVFDVSGTVKNYVSIGIDSLKDGDVIKINLFLTKHTLKRVKDSPATTQAGK